MLQVCGSGSLYVPRAAKPSGSLLLHVLSLQAPRRLAGLTSGLTPEECGVTLQHLGLAACQSIGQLEAAAPFKAM